MAYIIQASCTCGYTSKSLMVGDGEHFVAICDQCHAVVTPQFIPFEFTLPPCPNCGFVIQPDRHVDGMKLMVSFEQPVPSEHMCPQCRTDRLAFKEIMHLSMQPDEIRPQPNQVVHGILRGREIEIPGITIDYTCHLPEATKYEQNRAMELRVIAIENHPKSESAIKISLEFMRYLSGKDLGYRENQEH